MIAHLNDPDCFRKASPSKEQPQPIEVRRLDNTIEAHRQRRMLVKMQQSTGAGLWATSDRPLAAGERLAVSFSPGFGPGCYDAVARVVRCDKRGPNYRLSVQFDPRPAA
jgi:hypothetical protein